MPPVLFWRTTPRKFGALCKVHIDINDTSENKNKNKRNATQPEAYVDQLSFM